MPHQCVRCSTMYEDGSKKLLEGCECGAKLFFYVKKEHLEKRQKQLRLTEDERRQIEEDVYDVIGSNEPDHPVILDLESINVTSPGKYEIDIVKVFKGEPLIVKLEEGKYLIDVAESFEKLRHK